jgi:hypothetical protein
MEKVALIVAEDARNEAGTPKCGQLESPRSRATEKLPRLAAVVSIEDTGIRNDHMMHDRRWYIMTVCRSRYIHIAMVAGM